MNKKVYLGLIIIGLISFLTGIYLTITSMMTNEDEISIMIPATEEEKKEITSYLKDRYGDEFEVVEHTTSFCVVQDNINNSYTLDSKCEIDDIKDDIFKVKDKNNINFYVKKVTLKEGVNLIPKLQDKQFNLYYDNYITYISVNNIARQLMNNYTMFGEVLSVEVIKGIGVELPVFKKIDDKYESYYIYQDMNSDNISIANKAITIEEYVDFLGRIGKKDNFDIKVKINGAITGENVQEIVTLLNNNNFFTTPYGIMIESIILEFSNGISIIYSSDFTVKILKNYDYLNSENETYAYYKTITFNYTIRGDNIIAYDDFMKIDKSNFEF